jgi:UDP-glucose 4-epimerase
MSTFLVTGGCGFIGSHLCEALTGLGHHVRVVDDLSTGKRENLFGRESLIVGDIADPDLMREAVAGIDGCFHLAAIASVERGRQAWVETHRTNLTGAITVFDAVRRLPNAAEIPVVYASSAAVYGDCRTLPIEEGMEKVPLSAYGADKYGCELHARVATGVHGVPTVGLRFFNVYGPRQDPHSPYSGVISIFCNKLRRGERIDIYGDGEQTRDFIYVKDVVNVLLRAMQRPLRNAPVFNVCTGRATSVLQLADTIAGLLGQRAEIRFCPARSGEIRHSTGSPARAQAALDLPPTAFLRDGLAEVLRWLEQG